jgi:hypothetical protein
LLQVPYWSKIGYTVVIVLIVVIITDITSLRLQLFFSYIPALPFLVSIPEWSSLLEHFITVDGSIPGLLAMSIKLSSEKRIGAGNRYVVHHIRRVLHPVVGRFDVVESQGEEGWCAGWLHQVLPSAWPKKSFRHPVLEIGSSGDCAAHRSIWLHTYGTYPHYLKRYDLELIPEAVHNRWWNSVTVAYSESNRTVRCQHYLCTHFRTLGKESTTSYAAISCEDRAHMRKIVVVANQFQLLKDRAVWGALGIACTLNFGR